MANIMELEPMNETCPSSDTAKMKPGHGYWEGAVSDKRSLEQAEQEILVRGRWPKADVTILRHGENAAVLKDYNGKSFPVRWIGRYQLWKEFRAYRLLQGLAGIPVCYGQPDPYSLLIEYIDGKRLDACRGEPYDEPKMIEQLKTVIRSMNDRGMVHNDLRGRHNIRVRNSDQRIFLIDFSGAMIFRPGGLRHRLFFSLFRVVDEGAFLKWKYEFQALQMTPEERRRYKRINRIRRLWPFNRKMRKIPSFAPPLD